ncbi:MAG: hypothetical protein HOV80_13005 [Polyangiaceae bacterium]|nr:hypothetical protein [Polyangiaceae bacterium]
MTETETLASLRVLVAMARADGILSPPEEKAIEEAIEEANLEGVTFKSLFVSDFSLDEELDKLTSPEARRATYESVYALASVDDAVTAQEEALLEHIEAKLGFGPEQRSALRKLLDEAEDTVLPSHIAEVVDPERRAIEIREDTLKYSLLSAALGAFPIPGLAIATDLAVTALQTKLVRDVAQYYGKKLDKKQAAELLAGAGLGMGLRIALSNLAKLVPGWGSAVGAAGAFVSTYALGIVASRYFESGGKDASLLREQLAAAKKDAKEMYSQQKAAVAAKQAETKARLDQLGQELKDGKITKAEYEKQVEALV